MKTKFTRRICTVSVPTGKVETVPVVRFGIPGTEQVPVMKSKEIEFNSKAHKVEDLTDANMEQMAVKKFGPGTKLVAVREICTMKEAKKRH